MYACQSTANKGKGRTGLYQIVENGFATTVTTSSLRYSIRGSEILAVQQKTIFAFEALRATVLLDFKTRQSHGQLKQVAHALKLASQFFKTFKGKSQQNFLSSHLKETPKQYIKVYCRIFISALFGEIF